MISEAIVKTWLYYKFEIVICFVTIKQYQVLSLVYRVQTQDG